MEAEEWGGGSRNEDTKLVDSAVCWVKVAVGWERGCGEWKEECGCHAEVYSIFGYVDKEERDHTTVISLLEGHGRGRINWKKRRLREPRGRKEKKGGVAHYGTNRLRDRRRLRRKRACQVSGYFAPELG